MAGYRTALGIDISGGEINLALLRKSGDNIKLIKSAIAPVPEGVIKNGNIENPAALAKAIKKLKMKKRISAHHTAFSLLANPTLVQILNLPQDAFGNVRQYINNEVKHYAALPINKATVDFCKISSSVGSDRRRALIVATDGQKIANVVKAFNKKGLNIDVIEPAWMAYARACHEKIIAKKINTNLFFAMVNNGILTLFLFKDKKLDFIRATKIEPDISQSEQYYEWIAEQINAVLKFYKYGDKKQYDKWQVTLVMGTRDKDFEKETEILKDRIRSVELHIRTLQDAYLDTPIADGVRGNKPSAVAVGLAMKLFNTPCAGLNINLFPSEAVLAKSKERQILVVANIAAAIIILMILCVGFFSRKAEKLKADINHDKKTQVAQETKSLLEEQTLIQSQIKEISEKLDLTSHVIKDDSVLMYGRVLEDIGAAIPKNIRITDLYSNDRSKILINGQALTYDAIYRFIDALNDGKNIISATLIRTQNNGQLESLVGYSINCLLTQ
jgi:Tfp pilus assembly protein PilN